MKFYNVFSIILLMVSCSLCTTEAIIDKTSCGMTKLCYEYPTHCDPSSPDCIFYTSSYDSVSDVFRLELSGGTGNGEEYSSVGMGDRAKMEDADTYICTGNELLTGVIREHKSDPVIDATTPSEISDVTATTVDGVGVCTFTRKRSITRTISNSQKVNFDFYTTPYMLMYAGGKMEEGGKVPGYHHDNFHVVHNKIAFTSTAFAAECGHTIGCFTSPNDCEPGKGECKFLSWSYNKKENMLDFTLVGNAHSGAGYQSFGFADTQNMMDVDLYYCTASGVKSSVIVDLYDHPMDDESTTVLLNHTEYGVYDGAIVCKFSRPVTVSKTVSTGLQDFHLFDKKYYIQYSTGELKDTGAIRKHQNKNDYGSSDTKVNFTTKTKGGHGDNDAGSDLAMIKAHAIFMLMAWISCGNLGSVIARHYKKFTVWFQLHRTLMLGAVLFTAIATCLILIEVGGYPKYAGSHAIIGLVVVALCFINICMGFARPDGASNLRWIFNRVHQCVALSCRILAIACLFLGFQLSMTESTPAFQILAGFVANEVLVEVVLEFIPAFPCGGAYSFSCFKDNNEGKNSSKNYILGYLIATNTAFLLSFIVIVGSQ